MRVPFDVWFIEEVKKNTGVDFSQPSLGPLLKGNMLTWLKTDMGLGHVQANFIILYLRLRTSDPKVSEQAKKWADETGYLEYCPES